MTQNTTNDSTTDESSSNYALWYDFGDIHVGVRHAAYGHGATQSFRRATDDVADRIRGDLSETDGTPVLLVDSGGRTSPGDLDAINDGHRRKLAEEGYTLIAGVDAGWAEWNGRPEWSEWYVDYTDAYVVDHA